MESDAKLSMTTWPEMGMIKIFSYHTDPRLRLDISVYYKGARTGKPSAMLNVYSIKDAIELVEEFLNSK